MIFPLRYVSHDVLVDDHNYIDAMPLIKRDKTPTNSKNLPLSSVDRMLIALCSYS